MSNSTTFYINLAGDVSQQSQRFGRDVTQFSNKSTSALNKLSSRLKSTTNELRSIGSTLGGLSSKINGMGNIALPVVGVGVTAGLMTVGKSLIRTAADFEMADIRMNQIFGKRGKEASKWLKDFAKDTPMAFGDVQQAMMQLETAGIDPMNGSLQALVDYNAKIGGDTQNLNGYISAISKGFIKGKLSMEEINPLLERNVKVFEILAKETGGKYTADQMQKMLQDGKLGRAAINALLRGMGKDAQGAAKQQMKTWDGLVSNLDDTWVAMQARFMEHGAFDELKKELGGLVDWLGQKMDDGTLDEFAKVVSETLITALHDLKETANDVKPILESIGSAMAWVSEHAGGYGNIAKFVAALYAANKIARVSWSVGSGAYGIGKGTYNFGKNVYGVGKKLVGRGGKGGALEAVSNIAGGLANSAAGVQSVYVVNMPDVGFGGVGRSKGKKGRRALSKKSQTTQQKQRTQRAALAHKSSPTLVDTHLKTAVPATVAANVTKSASTAAAAGLPAVTPVAAQNTANAVKQAATSLKSSAASAVKTTTNVAKTATQAVGKTLGRAVPMLNVGLAAAQTASVIMDEDASFREKSEGIGSVAGATAGAIIGQMAIPVPVLGAAVGGFIGEKLGGWLGDWFGEKQEESAKINPDQAAQQVGSAMGSFIGSEVGQKLSGINPVETKLDGAVKVALSLSDDLVAKVKCQEITSNQKGQLQMMVETGSTSQMLYGAA
ncbi:tape measure protein [Mannheimia massilioguelmaensis]|uniref:tape measure protein n=1 Tax=Mannheimia massilioguelmaensis TaxID=1604354 RepID=UPI0005C9D93E|nr:tape measure protein [Mannheimia massilioguelmaensis]